VRLKRGLLQPLPVAAEALKKWDGGQAPSRGSGERACSLPSFGVWDIIPEFFWENIGANLWNLVHFGSEICNVKCRRSLLGSIDCPRPLEHATQGDQ